VALGEVGLEGGLRPIRGALSMALSARTAGCAGVLLPSENLSEAAVVGGIEVRGAGSLQAICSHLTGERPIAPVRVDPVRLMAERAPDAADFADVRGQAAAKRALEVAAAGSHNLILVGPPGAGKTMLARRLPGILPAMTLEEALETTKVHSVAGLLAAGQSLATTRPFRAPHHTISDAGLIGGGSWPRPGEVSLAHGGVLFLDELPEFRRNVLEVMRQPMEDGSVTLSRAAMSLTFPARFMLAAAMNPCPCGHHGDAARECRCDAQTAISRVCPARCSTASTSTSPFPPSPTGSWPVNRRRSRAAPSARASSGLARSSRRASAIDPESMPTRTCCRVISALIAARRLRPSSCCAARFSVWDSQRGRTIAC
jgi:magnesium chelatase family protein